MFDLRRSTSGAPFDGLDTRPCKILDPRLTVAYVRNGNPRPFGGKSSALTITAHVQVMPKFKSA